MNKTLIDNSANLKMVDTLKDCISTQGMDTIRIATGYWDIPGMALVIDELEEFLAKEGNKLKLLIGKDPYVYAKMLKEPKYQGKQYPQEFIRVGIDELADNLLDEHKRVINLLFKYCADDNKKIEIRIFKTNEEDESQFLHSKCYIFTNQDDDSKEMTAIVGSSNFTQKGLEGNAELNVLENDPYMISYHPSPSRKGHITWFEEKWEQAEDWTKEFLEQILQTSKPVKKIKEEEPEEEEAAPLTPYELYIKLLQTKFGTLVDKTLGQQIEDYLPERYDPYEYQIEAVKQCFSIMKEHGGFMLADVVGLGKTIVGTLVIKHFLSLPDEEGREQKVLIVTPPAIKSAWKDTIKEFDEGCDSQIAPFIDFITTGSIGKLVDDESDADDLDTGDFEVELRKENYGLIIIDESHKFRNSETRMYHAINDLIDQIGGEIGAYPYIGLLSATPQNNRPSDIQNQVYLFERNHTDSTLRKANGGNLESFFSDINNRYEAVMHPNEEDDAYYHITKEERYAALLQLSQEVRDCVLSDIMVRRTRTDINKYYQNDKEKQKLYFPEIKGPFSIEYTMSSTLHDLFSDSMRSVVPEAFDAPGLRYYRYRAIQFLLKPEDKHKYNARGSRDADALAEQLARIMQLNLVKRLESSFTAFKQSLLNLRRYTQNMIDMWGNDTIFICPQIDINAELDTQAKSKKRGRKVSFADCVEDIRAKIRKLTEEGRNKIENNKEYRRTDFNGDYIDLLHEDLNILSELCDRWAKNSEDPKFDEFKESLRSVLFNEERNIPRKLVIFTEAIDTAESIEAATVAKGYKTLRITAANRNEMEQTIRENFDANYKGEWKDDYQVIVTTDVLAEGINLHRANCILNYDTPWNGTRLMQRIGRVNRIGSRYPVYVYNFKPSAEGDEKISLNHKVHTKLQSFHTLFGEDSKIYSDNELVFQYERDLNSHVNGEESPLEKYIYELKQFKENNPKRYAWIEQTSEDLQQAVVTGEGTGYFLVRTPRIPGMFVKVAPQEEEGKVLSLSEGLERFRLSQDCSSCLLPENWPVLSKEAERVILAELASARNLCSNSRKATEAKGAIIKMKDKLDLSPESRKLLNNADRLIRQGNADIVQRILRISSELEKKNSIFPLTQEEIDDFISRGISNVVVHTQQKHGEPQIILGIYK